jgi:hypothetical protein
VQRPFIFIALEIEVFFNKKSYFQMIIFCIFTSGVGCVSRVNLEIIELLTGMSGILHPSVSIKYRPLWLSLELVAIVSIPLFVELCISVSVKKYLKFKKISNKMSLTII